jgi:hypothetical protein
MVRVWFLAVHLCKVVVPQPLQQLFCLVRTARSKRVLEGLGLVLLKLLQNLERRGIFFAISGWVGVGKFKVSQASREFAAY